MGWFGGCSVIHRCGLDTRKNAGGEVHKEFVGGGSDIEGVGMNGSES